MSKYRIGRKQKRVILDEYGHEVAIFNRKNSHLAQLCCDSLNKLLNVETVKLREDCSLKAQHNDMRSANWKYCSECGEKL